MVTDGTKTEVGATTSPEQQGTPQETPTYSQIHVDKLLEKVKSDSLAELGRVRKAAEDAIKKTTESSNARITQLIKEQEERELEAVKGNNDAITAIKERQARRKAEDELAKAREELSQKDSRLSELSTKEQETAREKRISEIAVRLKVDKAKLANLSKFTDGSAEAIESLAQEMPKANAQSPNPQNSLKPDNSEAAGGTGKTKYQIMADFNGGKINNEEYAKQMKSHGWQP